MKYTPKMSISGPATPLFTWAQLQKQVEDKHKAQSIFPHGKPKGFGIDKAQARKARKQAAAKAEWEAQVAQIEAENAAKKAEYENSTKGKIEGFLGNAYSDVKDVAKSPFVLLANMGKGVWNNGTDVTADVEGLGNFIKDTAKVTYDSYDELGAVKAWGDSLKGAASDISQGNLSGAGKHLLDAAVMANPLMPVPQLYETATNSNFTKFGKQVYEHPVFYAMDAAPAVGQLAKAGAMGAKVAAVAERVPIARQVVKAQAKRGLAYMMHTEKEIEGSRKAVFQKTVNAMTDETDHFVLYQAVHALDPKAEVMMRKAAKDAIDRGHRFTKGDVAESEVLKEVADKVGEKYGRFVNQFGKSYQKIWEKYRHDGNFSEFNSEVNALKKRIDKDLRKVADAYDTNAMAYLDDLRHRGLTDTLKTELRTRLPQMELMGYKTVKDIKKLMGDGAYLIEVGGGDLGWVVKEGSEWVVRVVDSKGATRVRLTPSFLKTKAGRQSFRKKYAIRDKATAERVISEYYNEMWSKMDKELGNDGFKPLYFKHTDRVNHPGSEDFTPDGGPRYGSSAQYKTKMTLWRQGLVVRNNAIVQAEGYLAGLNGYMKGEMMRHLIESARGGKAGVRIVTKSEDMPQPKGRFGKHEESIVRVKEDGWSDWEDIIFATKANVEEYNRIHPDKPLPIIPDPKDIQALVIDKDMATYLKRMTGIQKDAASKLEKATQIWKFGVLSMRPAFVVNNVVGNQVLAMLRDPGVIREQIVNAIGRVDRTMAKDIRGNYRYLGEHFADALESFGHTEKFDFGRFNAESGRYAGNKALDRTMRNFQNIANLGFKASMMHEEALRAGLLIRALKRDSRIKELMSKDRLPDVDGSTKVSRALDKIASDDPTYYQKLHADVTKGTNLTMGNYSFFSPMERRVKAVIPFYSWYRHIMKVAAREWTGPHAPLWVAEARVAQEFPELADYPTFAENFIPFQKDLPGSAAGENGRKRYLDMTNMNPFATVPEVLAAGAVAASAMVPGGIKPGQGGGEVLSMVNPLITAPLEFMSGRDLRTGAQIDATSVPGRIVDKLPPVELMRRSGLPLIGNQYDPLKDYDPNNPDTWRTAGGKVSTKGVTPSAYSKNFSTALYRWFGVPIQDVNPDELVKLGDKLRSESQGRKYTTRKLPDPPAFMRSEGDKAEARKRSKDILDLAFESGKPVPDFYWQRVQEGKGAYRNGLSH